MNQIDFAPIVHSPMYVTWSKVLSRSLLLLTGLLLCAVPPQAQVDRLPDLWAVDGDIRGMAIVEDTLYATGLFRHTGYPTGQLAVLDPEAVTADLTWDRLQGEVHAIEPDGNGGYFVGGYFHTHVDGERYHNLVRFRPDGSIDPLFRPDPVAPTATQVLGLINEILFVPDAPGGDGILVIAGRFEQVRGPDGQASRQDLAAIDLATGDVLPLSATFHESNGYWGLRAAAYQDGVVYAGGSFSAVNGQSRTSLAAFDLLSGGLLPWQIEIDPSGGVSLPIIFAVVPSDAGLYILGMVSAVNGQPRDALFEVLPADPETGDGGILTEWAPQGGGGTVLVVTDDHVWMASNYLPGPRVLARADRQTAAVTHYSVGPGYRNGRALAYRPGGGPSGAGVLYLSFQKLESFWKAFVVVVDPATGQAFGPEIQFAGSTVPGATSDVPPFVLEVTSDGRLLAGGNFTVTAARFAPGGHAAFDLTTGRALEGYPPAASSSADVVHASPDGRFLYTYVRALGGAILNLEEIDLATGHVRDFLDPDPLPPPPPADWPEDLFVANSTSALLVSGDTLFVSISGPAAFDRNDASLHWHTSMANVRRPHEDQGSLLMIPAGDDSVFGSQKPTLMLSVPSEYGPIATRRTGFFAVDPETGEVSDWYPAFANTFVQRGYGVEYLPESYFRPSSLYLGGRFDGSVEGQNRLNVMAVDPSSAGLLDWDVCLGGGSYEDSVHSILAIPEGTELEGQQIGGVVYIGGGHLLCPRYPYRQTFLVAMDATTAEHLEWDTHLFPHGVRRLLYSERHGALFVGGRFTGALAGSGHSGIVAVSPYGWQPPVTTEPAEPQRPWVVALSAPFPNPARDRAQLTLSLPEAGSVEVAVYDVLGRRVAVLHEGPLTAGEHALAVDASALASGLYVVRAAGEKFGVSRRITVVR